MQSELHCRDTTHVHCHLARCTHELCACLCDTHCINLWVSFAQQHADEDELVQLYKILHHSYKDQDLPVSCRNIMPCHTVAYWTWCSYSPCNLTCGSMCVPAASMCACTMACKCGCICLAVRPHSILRGCTHGNRKVIPVKYEVSETEPTCLDE